MCVCVFVPVALHMCDCASSPSSQLLIHLSLTVPLPEAATVAQKRALGAPGVIPLSKAIVLTLTFPPHSAIAISIMLMFSTKHKSPVCHNKKSLMRILTLFREK